MTKTVSNTAKNAETVAAIILARGGSKGLPGKNLRRIGGLSLVARAIRAARAAKGVTAGVWVSTDAADIADEARAYGAEVIDRPADLASDTACSEAGWLHAFDVIKARHPTLARLVFLQCTSPFTQGRDIDACLAAQTQEGAECALSVVPDHGFLWQRGADGFAQGVNHDATQPRQRRQDLAPQYRESGAIYTVDAAAFAAKGARFCGSVALCPVDHPALEIDTEADLTLARALMPTRAEVPPDRLAQLKAVVMDFDGVHTDDRVITDETGREAVRTSRRDGMGLSRLRRLTDLRLLILSGEVNAVVQARAAKLQIAAQHGVTDKRTALDHWLKEQGIAAAETLYIGNDINDLDAMALVGLSACPCDAVAEVLAVADWVLPAPGGQGALRALADRVLEALS